jgi:class 3 adenylate cyclase
MSQTRRLAAILAADLAGYSRLMGEDEEGTLQRLKALRRELIDQKSLSTMAGSLKRSATAY